MMINIEDLDLQYVTDAKGEKTAVVIPINEFNQLVYDFKFAVADIEGKKVLLKAEIDKIEDERILKFIHQFILLLKQGEVISVEEYFKKYWNSEWITA